MAYPLRMLMYSFRNSFSSLTKRKVRLLYQDHIGEEELTGQERSQLKGIIEQLLVEYQVISGNQDDVKDAGIPLKTEKLSATTQRGSDRTQEALQDMDRQMDNIPRVEGAQPMEMEEADDEREESESESELGPGDRLITKERTRLKLKVCGVELYGLKSDSGTSTGTSDVLRSWKGGPRIAYKKWITQQRVKDKRKRKETTGSDSDSDRENGVEDLQLEAAMKNQTKKKRRVLDDSSEDESRAMEVNRTAKRSIKSKVNLSCEATNLKLEIKCSDSESDSFPSLQKKTSVKRKLKSESESCDIESEDENMATIKKKSSRTIKTSDPQSEIENSPSSKNKFNTEMKRVSDSDNDHSNKNLSLSSKLWAELGSEGFNSQTETGYSDLTKNKSRTNKISTSQANISGSDSDTSELYIKLESDGENVQDVKNRAEKGGSDSEDMGVDSNTNRTTTVTKGKLNNKKKRLSTVSSSESDVESVKKKKKNDSPVKKVGRPKQQNVSTSSQHGKKSGTETDDGDEEKKQQSNACTYMSDMSEDGEDLPGLSDGHHVTGCSKLVAGLNNKKKNGVTSKKSVSSVSADSSSESDDESPLITKTKAGGKKTSPLADKQKSVSSVSADSSSESDDESPLIAKTKAGGKKTSPLADKQKAVTAGSGSSSNSDDNSPSSKKKKQSKKKKSNTDDKKKKFVLSVTADSSSESDDDSPLITKTKAGGKKTSPSGDQRKAVNAGSGSSGNSDDDSPASKKKKQSKKKKSYTDNNKKTKKSQHLVQLQKICRAAGLFYASKYRATDTDQEKISKLKEFLNDSGMHGRPSMKLAKKLRLKREAAELDTNNIISDTAGRSRRKVDSLFSRAPSPPRSRELTTVKQKFSRLQDVIDSEEFSD